MAITALDEVVLTHAPATPDGDQRELPPGATDSPNLTTANRKNVTPYTTSQDAISFSRPRVKGDSYHR